MYAGLESVGLPRHHLGLIWTVQSWYTRQIAPDVAFSLWLLREAMHDDGALPHRLGAAREDVGPAIRYVELAWLLGERLDTDPELRKATKWVISQEQSTGGIPPSLEFPIGETGTTARALRALNLLSTDPVASDSEDVRKSLQDEITSARRCAEALVAHIKSTVRRADGDSGWSYTTADPGLIVGATSLAALALAESEPAWPRLRDVFEFLIRAQRSDGGWSEIPGGPSSTIHNSFNALRAIKKGHDVGIVDDSEWSSVRRRAASWFRQQRHWYGRNSISDAAFAVRLAAQLDLVDGSSGQRLVRSLTSRRSRYLSRESDLYWETALVALALEESSRKLTSPSQLHDWDWLYRLPRIAPPFLTDSSYMYELLYVVVPKRSWFRTVDWFIGFGLIDRAVGLSLGAVVASGLVSQPITDLFTVENYGPRQMVALSIVIFGLLLWTGVKASARLSLWRALRGSVGSALIAVLLVWLVFGLSPFLPTSLALAGLLWLIIDMVAYTADSSGLLDRLLNK